VHTAKPYDLSITIYKNSVYGCRWSCCPCLYELHELSCINTLLQPSITHSSSKTWNWLWEESLLIEINYRVLQFPLFITKCAIRAQIKVFYTTAWNVNGKSWLSKYLCTGTEYDTTGGNSHTEPGLSILIVKKYTNMPAFVI